MALCKMSRKMNDYMTSFSKVYIGVNEYILYQSIYPSKRGKYEGQRANIFYRVNNINTFCNTQNKQNW